MSSAPGALPDAVISRVRESAVSAMRPVGEPRWRAELIAHADAVRAGRVDIDAVIRWLICEIAVRGWPVRRLVGEDGALAGLQLATHAPAPYRAGWLPKVNDAMTSGGVPRPAAREFITRVAAERAGR